MDDKGRLIIHEDGKEKFRGKTFQENGLKEWDMNRANRRKNEAIARKLRKQIEKQTT